MICQNQVRCLKCGDEPYSAYRHDFKECKCGAVAVDGGMSYLKRSGDISNYVELSYSIDDAIVEECKDEVFKIRDSGRNDLGIILGVFRILNKHGRLITDRNKGV